MTDCPPPAELSPQQQAMIAALDILQASINMSVAQIVAGAKATLLKEGIDVSFLHELTSLSKSAESLENQACDYDLELCGKTAFREVVGLPAGLHVVPSVTEGAGQ